MEFRSQETRRRRWFPGFLASELKPAFPGHPRLAKTGPVPLFRAVSSPSPARSGGSRTEWIWAAVLLVLAAAFYGWTATSAGSPLTSKLQSDDLYNRLSDALLAGQLSFLEEPNPALAQLADPWDPAQNGPLRKFHDVSYYHGKYYLYFGVAPAVLLLAPWKAVTGTYLGQNVAVAVFAWLGAAASMGLVMTVRRRYFSATPAWVGGLCLVAAAFGNFVPVLLRRPVYYELAIASAYAFAMAAMLAVVFALDEGPKRRRWLFLAGLAYGLVIASRPNYLFGAVVLAAPFLPVWRLWRAKQAVDWRTVGRDALAALLPLGGIVALLLLYNHLRFDRWADFGTSYMLAGLHPQHDALTSFRFLPVNLWFYLFAPAQFSAFFPFIQVIHMPWFTLPAGYIGEENMYGVLPNLPFFWMLYFVRRLWIDPRGSTPVALRDFIAATLGLVAFNALIIFRLNGASCRYLVDLLPPLLPLACIGVFWVEQTIAGTLRRIGWRLLWIGALAWTAGFNILVSLQHNELLRYHNPATYRRLAYAFNHLSGWLGETGPSHTGPLRIRLTLPTERTGKLEPLLVTGASFRADFLYVFYTDEHHLQIGFEHTSYGGPMTKPPVEVDYAAEHTLEVEMGSLYPPVEHPFYDGMSADEIARRKRTLRVVLDGRELLSGQYDFYDSSPGDVTVGRNTVSDAFGRGFNGRIISVERVGTVVPTRK